MSPTRNRAGPRGAAPVLLLHRELDHRGVRSSAVTSPPAARQDRDVARAAREVERAAAGQRSGEAGEPLPAPVLPGGQEHGDEVVAVRDGGKQAPDVGRLAARRGDGSRRPGHGRRAASSHRITAACGRQ